MSHRRLRAARSLIAVAALALSALVVPQLASADTGVPNTATITVHDGVSSLWSDQTHWPQGFARPWSDDAQAFLAAAMGGS